MWRGTRAPADTPSQAATEPPAITLEYWMHLYRYGRWDGSQQLDPFTADDLMKHLSDSILEERDLWSAMRDMFQHGANLTDGRRMAGLRDLLDRLRQRRQDQLNRYNLGSIMDDIKERLERVLQTEREGIQRRLQGAPPGPPDSEQTPDSQRQAQSKENDQPGESSPASPAGSPSPFSNDTDLQQLLESMARRRLDQLDALPPDVGGRIQQLRDYDFMDPEARQQFEELLDQLKAQVLQNYFQGMKQALGAATPEQMAELKNMLQDLNEMLEQHRRGDDSGFQDFMEKWGQYFPSGIQNPDQLAQHLQQQMAQMRSLMESMTPEMRHELQQMVDALFQDGGLMEEIADLVGNLSRMFPQPGERFSFTGDEPVTMQEAMRLMGDMQDLDQLERELMDAARLNDASRLDPDQIGRLVGDEARQMAEELQSFVRMLEEAGFIQRKGRGWLLTPRAMRKIGERALEEIFGRIDPSVSGDHTLTRYGWGTERLDETKIYAYGDPFAIDAQGTIMNALRRQGRGTPIRLDTDDFEIHRSASVNQCSTVIALDMSTSMHRRGIFQSARKVALALDTLIRTKYPRDFLKVVAFSHFVLPIEPYQLLDDYWIDPRGTDITEALHQARAILGKRKGGTKQIILITDGQPRSIGPRFGWSGDWYDGAGWSMHDLMEEVLREVGHCTREDITVNTFMLETEPVLTTFVKTLTKLNSGRVFFADPNQLGEYLIVDYVKNRRKTG
ncbi:MAG: VWA domain-containing protein [Chloroflexi bacterium]|nr:VWA domain-containing protein [Chloroflexota bacterium]